MNLRRVAGIVVSLPALAASTDGAQRAFQTFGIREGLSNLSVWCMVSDPAGFLWVGTEGGLLRFDGRKFDRFGPEQGLPNASINALHVDRRGRLWAGTTAGVALYVDGAFRRPARPHGVEEGPVTSLESDAAGNLWIGTLQGPWRGTSEAGIAPVAGWSGGLISAMGETSDGTPWLAAWTGHKAQVMRWSGTGWISLALPPSMTSRPLEGLACTPDGSLWARSLAALWVASREGRFTPSPFPVAPVAQRTFLRTDAQGGLWFQSGSTVRRLDPGPGARIRTYDQVPDFAIRTLHVDAEGTLWLAGGGLARRLDAQAWSRYGLQQGLPSEVIWGFLRDRTGRLHVGTDRGIATLSGSRWIPVPGSSEYQVRTMVETPDGSILVAGSPQILQWRPGSGKITGLGPGSGLRPGRRIFRMLRDPEGVLWVATEGEGLQRGTLAKGTWRFDHETLPGELPGEIFQELCLDNQGRLWAAGSRGLLMREGGRWKRFTRADGLKEDHVTHVAVARDGSLLGSYAATGGAFCFSVLGGRLDRIRPIHPDLPQDLVAYLVAEDSAGCTWVGTGAGVFVIHPAGTLERFTTLEGLAGDDINSQAFLSDPGGKVWIGTSTGIATLSGLPAPPAPPLPKVMETQHQDRNIAGGSGGEIVLHRPQADLEVRFFPGSLRPPSSLETQVRLVGLETHWRTTESDLEHFQSLEPGIYRFEVRSRYVRSVWGPTTAVTFRVLPAWWESRLAVAAYLLTLAAAAYGAHRGRVRLLRRRNEHLQEMVRAATDELQTRKKIVEDQAEDLERINRDLRELNTTLNDLNAQKTYFLGVAAHDLRNPINSIVLTANYLELEVQDPELAKMARTIAREGMEMSKLLGRLLDVAAIENGTIAANPAWSLLVETVMEGMARLEAKAAAKAINLALAPVPDLAPVWMDPRLALEVVDNLLSNAIKFSPKGSRITLHLQGDGGEQRLGIQDQGPGLTPEDKAELYGRFKVLSARPTAGEKSTGLGLSIVKKLMELMGGRVWVESEPGQGATFWIAFPRQQA